MSLRRVSFIQMSFHFKSRRQLSIVWRTSNESIKAVDDALRRSVSTELQPGTTKVFSGTKAVFFAKNKKQKEFQFIDKK
jgi:hypothetical protein